MSDSELTISFITNDKQTGLFRIYEESKNSLFQIDKAEALENSESEYQILEGRSYEYLLDDGYCIEPTEIVSRSKTNSSSGRISPNIYVGTLTLDIIYCKSKEKCARINLEVRSVKTTYRTDYRQMLVDITDQCTDLLMLHSSPVSQTFTIDFNKDAQTLYQRFTFLKSIIDSEEFDDSVHKILSSPVNKWIETEIYSDIRGMRKANSKTIRQIATAGNRMNLPENHPLKNHLESVPQKININHKTETVDTPENRFIKYALQSFLTFCEELKRNQKASLRLKKEVSVVSSKLEQYLGHSIFKEISRPTTLTLNSPVLQKKEGYREILRAWLMFDLAAKLTWQGGEDVYSGGKRDIAVLYEYWLFFKLLELLKDVFKIEPKSIEDLIKPTADGLGLQLKQGKHIPIKGIFDAVTRKLNVQFSYNRSFSGNKEYPNSGSWSGNMRPDYTLSIWPAEIDETIAEKEELIVHIHFDAKYRVDKLKDILGADNESDDEEKTEKLLDEEKVEQNRGTFKRADILKMHAYRDAIRRTAGAYVLYPGTESKTKPGFHEILPGLGAFAISPSKSSIGTRDLKKFLYDVIDHFLNRASQREKMSLKTYESHKDKNSNEVNESLPEPFGTNRSLLPDETFVLIGFYKDDNHLEWIIRNKLYNARTGSAKGSLRLSQKETGAKYILLHTTGETKTNKILKVKADGPRMFSKNDMLELLYPNPDPRDFYLVYNIEDIIEKEFKSMKWDITQLSKYESSRGSGKPFAVSLTELMKVKVK